MYCFLGLADVGEVAASMHFRLGAYFGKSDRRFRNNLTGRFGFNLTDLSERKRRWTYV